VRAISLACYSRLGQSRLVGRRDVTRIRHPAYRVNSCITGQGVNEPKELGASYGDLSPVVDDYR
jgi:hypothetical protein